MTAVAGPAVAVSARARRSPYQGLAPYQETDSEWFFGRDEWCDVIGDNLRAYRITVLYGRSGVGKSSVLRAGVVRKLVDDARDNLAALQAPRLLPVYFASWSLDDPVAALCEAIASAAREISPDFPSAIADEALADALRRWPEVVDGPLLLVLDQLEEMFRYHGRAKAAVIETVGAVLRDPDPAVHLLLSLRDDALAKLDGFEPRVAGMLDHRLELARLDRAAAREAIEKPVARWNETVAGPGDEVELEQELVDAVLDQVTAGRVSMSRADAAAPASGGSGRPDAIEAPFLQLVLDRLWSEEQAAWSTDETASPRILRLDTLEQLGGAERIVRTHLDTVLRDLSAREQEVAGHVFHYLVSPSGTKIAQRIADLAEYAQLPEQRIEPIVDRLTGEVRILRSAGEGRYEIYHDALVGPILDWRGRWEERRRRRRERVRLALAVAVVLALVAVTGVISVLAIQASRQHHDALVGKSQAVAAEARATLEGNPRAALRLALDAAGTSLTNATEATLRAALTANLPYSTLLRRDGAVTTAGFSPDGKRIVVGTAGEVQVRNAATRELIWAHAQPGVVRGAAFSPDGSLLATVGDTGIGEILDAVSGRTMATLGGARPSWSIRKASAAFSPDGTRLVTADSTGTAEIWSRTGRLLGRLKEGGPGLIVSASFSPDGDHVVTASDDGTARIWDLAGTPLRTLGGATGRVWDAAYSPDGRRIVTADDDGTARIWDAADGSSLQTLRGPNGTLWSASFSPDGRLVVAASEDGTARVWDTASGRTLYTLSSHSGPVHSAVFSHGGTSILTASNDGTARVWDFSSARNLRVLTGRRGVKRKGAYSPGAARSAAFDPKNQRVLVTGGEGGQVWMWDSAGRRHALAQLRGSVLSLAFSRDGSLIAAAGDDGQVLVVDGTTTESLPGLSGNVASVAFSPDSRSIAAAGEHGQVRIWDVAGHRTRPLLGLRANVFSVAFSPDGKRLIAAGEQAGVRVWDVASGATLQAPQGVDGDVLDTAFSPNGKSIVTAGADGTVRIWDTTSGRELRTFRGHGGPVRSVSFSPSGTYIVTASDDGTARIWEATTGIALQTLWGHDDVLWTASFGPDGRRILTTSRDGTARLWACSTCAIARDDLLERAEKRLAGA